MNKLFLFTPNISSCFHASSWDSTQDQSLLEKAKDNFSPIPNTLINGDKNAELISIGKTILRKN